MSASVISDPAANAGLFSVATRKPIPLDHVRVEALVVDACARVTLHQSYRNAENVPLEVVYTFPLNEGAAVCGFEATVGGVRYVGRAMNAKRRSRTSTMPSRPGTEAICWTKSAPTYSSRAWAT